MSPNTFCTYCGVRQSTYNTGKFDSGTGEPVFSERCQNEKCWVGCDNTGGHKYDKRWFRGSAACQKCGHVPLECW